MKYSDRYIHLLPPSTQQFTAVWEYGVIILDTNILLNLYRIPEIARIETMAILREKKAQIWIPPHCMLEFLRNRAKVRKHWDTKFSAAERELNGLITKFSKEIGELKLNEQNYSVNEDQLLAPVREAFNSVLESIVESREKAASKCGGEDEVLIFVMDTFGELTGPDLDEESLKQVRSEYTFRTANRIPPGFRDESKGGGNSSHIFYRGREVADADMGDFILWRESLEYVRDRKVSHVLFITDEKKDDWWLKDENKNLLGPHPNLLEEMYSVDGVQFFYLYRFAEFLKWAGTQREQPISPEVLLELEKSNQLMELDNTEESHEFESGTFIDKVLGAIHREIPGYLMNDPGLNLRSLTFESSHSQFDYRGTDYSGASIVIMVQAIVESNTSSIMNAVRKATIVHNRVLQRSVAENLLMVLIFRSFDEALHGWSLYMELREDRPNIHEISVHFCMMHHSSSEVLKVMSI